MRVFRYWYTRQWQEVRSRGHVTQITCLSERQPAWSFPTQLLQQLAFRTGKHRYRVSSKRKNGPSLFRSKQRLQQESDKNCNKNCNRNLRHSRQDRLLRFIIFFSAVYARLERLKSSPGTAVVSHAAAPLQRWLRQTSLRYYGLHFNGPGKTGFAKLLTTWEPSPSLHTVLSKCKWCWICCGQA